MDGVLKEAFVLLQNLAQFGGQVIVSDALINDGAFLSLKSRALESTVMLSSVFQKFKHVPVRLRSESALLEKLVDHCNADEPLLFGFDSCEVVTEFYHR